MKYSVMTLAALPMGADGTQEQLADIYKQIKAGGVDYIDPGTIDAGVGGIPAIRSAMEEAGLKAGCFLCFVHAPRMTAKGVEAAIQEGCQGVEDAISLGTKLMMYVPFGYDQEIQGFPREEIAKQLCACLRPVTEYAEQRGVTVVVEDDPHRGIPMCSTEELETLFLAVPKAKLVYDSGNMVCCGEDPVTYYDTFAGRTVHAHIKELFDGEDRMDGGSIGQGDVDFPTLLSHMMRQNYDGILTIETLDHSLGITEAVKRAVSYLDEIRRQI